MHRIVCVQVTANKAPSSSQGKRHDEKPAAIGLHHLHYHRRDHARVPGGLVFCIACGPVCMTIDVVAVVVGVAGIAAGPEIAG
jgi:hypothetical protein